MKANQVNASPGAPAWWASEKTSDEAVIASVQATSGGTIFSHTWEVDIPATVGANTAYVGFTGSSGGGAHAVQSVEAWTYAAAASSAEASPPVVTPAVPAPPTNLQVK